MDVPQCSTIELVPQGGTPPYRLTVAPALHDPLNITVGDEGIRWENILVLCPPNIVNFNLDGLLLVT